MPTDWQHNPARDASLMPFWFWNDAIDADDIRRSIADFDAHGVYGFVIHPRVGLPRSIGWMSDAMLDLMQVAIDEAARRDMRVILYDEGMYPSGSSSGQVVARDPSLAARCLALHDADQPLPPDANHVTTFQHAGKHYNVIDRKADSYIRGLHYTDEATAAEDEPPAGDILNPRTAQLIIELVYERFAARFHTHFGKTVLGIFTDEPNALGKCREQGVWPGSLAFINRVMSLTGEDLRPSLKSLWFDDGESASHIRADYRASVRAELRSSWYEPLSTWCTQHGLWLMGHPDAGDDLPTQRYFHVPGQDLVWRFIEPGKPSAIEGPESTQAKGTASAKWHSIRPRNSNEFCGAYGHETTFDEVRWLARWCLVRGVDLLIPHAFYHSIRGPRCDERPPQLGPHTPNWDDGSFARFAAECQRLSALNMAGQPVCDIAILVHGQCPWRAAKHCFENQRDFIYLPTEILWDGDVRVQGDLLLIGSRAKDRPPIGCRALIVEDDLSFAQLTDLEPFISAGRLIRFDGNAPALIAALDRLCPRDVAIDPPSRDLRVRHVRVDGPNGHDDVYMLFNEGNARIAGTLTLAASGLGAWIDPETGTERSAPQPLTLELEPWQIAVLRVRQSPSPPSSAP